jgi:hypothetical protein
MGAGGMIFQACCHNVAASYLRFPTKFALEGTATKFATVVKLFFGYPMQEP